MVDTLVPLFFMSNGTHLSNSAGDKKEWPEHMTIRNLSSTIRQIHSTHSIAMVTFLWIPIINCTNTQMRHNQQRQTNRELLNEALQRTLHHLSLKHNPSAESGYYKVLCQDANFRRCKLVSAWAWLADCPECSDLHHVEQHVCFWCKCP